MSIYIDSVSRYSLSHRPSTLIAVCSSVPLFCSGLAPCLLSYLQYVTSNKTVHISLLCSAYWFHGLPAAQQHMRQRAGVTEEGATDSVRWR